MPDFKDNTPVVGIVRRHVETLNTGEVGITGEPVSPVHEPLVVEAEAIQVSLDPGQDEEEAIEVSLMPENEEVIEAPLVSEVDVINSDQTTFIPALLIDSEVNVIFAHLPPSVLVRTRLAANSTGTVQQALDVSFPFRNFLNHANGPIPHVLPADDDIPDLIDEVDSSSESENENVQRSP